MLTMKQQAFNRFKSRLKIAEEINQKHEDNNINKPTSTQRPPPKK